MSSNTTLEYHLQANAAKSIHALIGILDYFERLQAIRASLQVFSFCGMLVSLFYWLNDLILLLYRMINLVLI